MRKIIITPNRTYATAANAEKAVIAKFEDRGNSRYFIMKTEEGRYFPVFLGEEAVHEMVHFHFNVVA
jgi:hypothetical protein